MRSLLAPLVAAVFLPSPVDAQWLEEAHLVASDGAANDQFGGVALSGATLLVGAPLADVQGFPDTGAGYVFDYDGSSWNQTAKLALNPPSDGNFLGKAVALEGDIAVMGVFLQATTGTHDGAAVFRRSGGVWAFDAFITPPSDTIAALAKFGNALDLSGSSIVIGAKRDGDAGTAFVFSLTGAEWVYEGELFNSTPAGSRFGQSVSISGDRLVIGAPNDGAGSAWVYERSGSTWFLSSKLSKSNGSNGDQFGISVAIDQDTILVGANFDDTGAGSNSGSAAVFRLTGSTWVQEAILLPADMQMGDNFGKTVSLDGDTAAVGAWRDSLPPGVAGTVSAEGSAYVFNRAGTTWTEAQKLTASVPASGDKFAFFVDLEGDLLAAGAPHEDPAGVQNQGAVHVFRSGAAPACVSCTRHCEAGATALGCSPLLSGWGTPSRSMPANFSLYAHGIEPGNAALFAVSTTGRAATPFADHSSLLCLTPPLYQSGLVKVGTDAAGPCGGTLRGDLATLLASVGSAIAVQPGTVLQAQLWISDPMLGGAITSDAVEFTIQP